MILERARRIFEIESEAILRLRERLNEDFVKAVNLIFECRGKVIVTGIGKSGLVSQKMASTFACSGTPAFFLHPAEGLHGDIGMIARDDVIIAVSNSGETEELLKRASFQVTDSLAVSVSNLPLSERPSITIS